MGKAILIHKSNFISINSFLCHNLQDKRGLQPTLKCNNIILIYFTQKQYGVKAAFREWIITYSSNLDLFQQTPSIARLSRIKVPSGKSEVQKWEIRLVLFADSLLFKCLCSTLWCVYMSLEPSGLFVLRTHLWIFYSSEINSMIFLKRMLIWMKKIMLWFHCRNFKTFFWKVNF